MKERRSEGGEEWREGGVKEGRSGVKEGRRRGGKIAQALKIKLGREGVGGAHHCYNTDPLMSSRVRLLREPMYSGRNLSWLFWRMRVCRQGAQRLVGNSLSSSPPMILDMDDDLVASRGGLEKKEITWASIRDYMGINKGLCGHQ